MLWQHYVGRVLKSQERRTGGASWAKEDGRRRRAGITADRGAAGRHWATASLARAGGSAARSEEPILACAALEIVSTSFWSSPMTPEGLRFKDCTGAWS